MKEEEIISFKHFTLFRKVVLNQQTGVLLFITRLGFAGRLPFVRGQLAANIDEKQLKHFFSQPMERAYWEDSSIGDANTKTALVLLSDILEHLEWNGVYRDALKNMLGKLPVVQVESMSIQFDDYRIEICSSLLYRQSLTAEDFRPQNFLQGIESTGTVVIRLKVLLLAYACGLMNAKQAMNKPKKRVQSAALRGVPGIAARIFNRIKGI